MSRRARPFVALAFCAWASLAPLSAVPDQHETWIELRSQNFILLSATSEATTRRVAGWLETFRAVLPAITSNIRIDSPQPTLVYLFRNGTSFEPYKGKEISAASVYRKEANLIALNALAYASWSGKGAPPTRDLYHEFTHLLVRNNFSNPPLWANEGLAEYYSTFRRSGGRGDVGRAIPNHLVLLRKEPWIPLSSLVRLTSREDDPSHRRIFYPQSWVLVHYLVSSGPGLSDRFHQYLELVDQGMPSGSAFATIFGEDLSELERDLRDYVAWNHFLYARIKVPPLPKAVASEPRVLPREEILSRLGELLSWTRPDDLAGAEGHYRLALNLRPDYVPALIGLGDVLQRQGRRAESEQAYRRSVEVAPSDSGGWYLLGNAVLTRFLREGTGETDLAPGAIPQAVAEARRHFARSVELAPRNGDALGALGATYAFQPAGHREGITALRSAVALLPQRMDLVYNLLVLHLLDEDSEAARRQAGEALRRAPEALVGSVGAAVRSLHNPDHPGARARLDDIPAVVGAIDAELDAAVADPRRRADLRDALRILGAAPPPSSAAGPIGAAR